MPLALLIPLITAFGPALANLIPQIAKMMKPDSISSAKDAANVSQIIDVITKAAGAPNLQAAVEQMQASPDLVKTVTTAVVNDPQIIQILEVGQGGIAGAAERGLAMQNSERPFWYNPVFWISMIMLSMPMMLLVDCLFIHPYTYDAATKTQIVTATLVIISLIGAFWMGTSAGSIKKDATIAAQAGVPQQS